MGAEWPLAASLRQEEPPLSLVRWVPAFCCSVRDLERPLGDAVADGLDELLLGIEGPIVAAPGDDTSPSAAPLNLEDSETDLGQLVDWLSTPCRCGLFLSTAVIERLAREFGVPRGFGNRRRLLRALIEGGSRYDGLEGVLKSITELAGRHRSLLGTTYGSSPLLEQATRSWRDRLSASQELLREAAELFVSRDRN